MMLRYFWDGFKKPFLWVWEGAMDSWPTNRFDFMRDLGESIATFILMLIAALAFVGLIVFIHTFKGA